MKVNRNPFKKLQKKQRHLHKNYDCKCAADRCKILMKTDEYVLSNIYFTVINRNKIIS